MEELSPENIDATEVTLTWKEPESDGGSPITRYKIERKDSKRNSWNNEVYSTETEVVLTKLKEGNSYFFRVCAENDIGFGPWTETPEAITPKSKYSVPSPPLNPKVSEIFKTECTITWDEPESDGGKPITGYILEKRQIKSKLWIKHKAIITSTEVKITELIEGNEYEFRVLAENEIGVSEPSEFTKPITAEDPWKKPTAPSKPEISTVKGKSMNLEWNAPESDGGAQIEEYVLEYRTEKDMKWKNYHSKETITELRTVASNLKENESYQWKVAAVNKAGRGPFSEPSDYVKAIEPLIGSAPEIKPCLDDQTILSSNSVSFKTTIEGNPDPKITWYKDGRLLQSGNNIKISYKNSTAELIIKETSEKDKGTYKVSAVNKIGKSESEANLTVDGKFQNNSFPSEFIY